MKKSMLGLLFSLVTLSLAAPALAEGEGGVGDTAARRRVRMSKAGKSIGMGPEERAKKANIKDNKSWGKEKMNVGRRGAKTAAAKAVAAESGKERRAVGKKALAGKKMYGQGKKQVKGATKAKAAQNKRLQKRFGAKKAPKAQKAPKATAEE